MWAFVSAIQSGDMAALQKVLADDVVATISDGGGHVRAALKPIVRTRSRSPASSSA
ncbi:MAG: hypothetical protein U0235_13400 [Polyangiaceae bacterium]